jgi:uncharacterized protein (DUF2267 family)
MGLNFEKYAQEGSHFVNKLANSLGHPDETARAGNVLRAVLHTFRDRITVGQSFHVISQLPMFLKAIYVDKWKYRQHPLKLSTKEDFLKEVESYQRTYGEREFNWDISTEDIVQTVFRELKAYISEGEFEDVISQLPKGLAEIFSPLISHH